MRRYILQLKEKVMCASHEYSSHTIRQYTSCITSLRRLYIDTVKQDFIIPDTFQDSEQIMKLLLNVYKKDTTMNFISAILWKLKESPSEITQRTATLYHEQAKLIKSEIEREKIGKEFELTEKEKKSFMLWENIQEIYSNMAQTLDRTNYNSFMDFVILSLYVLHPPVRADYAQMRVFIDDTHITDDIKDNYCVLQDNPRFVFQIYKTAKHKGTTVIPIDDELHSILLDWMEVNTSDYLLASYFPSRNKYKPFSDSTLCKRITAIFIQHSQKPVTINTLRHSFISFMSRHDQEYNIKHDNAKKMMHSVEMADKYRRMVYIQ